MNQLKRLLGLVWMIIGPVLFIVLINSAMHNINANGKGDINKPLPWIIIICIFIPIGIGLVVFGWYAFKGEYDTRALESKEG